MAKMFKITDSRRIPSLEPGRLGKDDMLIIVSVDNGVQFPVRLPAEDYDDEKLKAAVNALLTERGGIVGREIEL